MAQVSGELKSKWDYPRTRCVRTFRGNLDMPTGYAQCGSCHRSIPGDVHDCPYCGAEVELIQEMRRLEAEYLRLTARAIGGAVLISLSVFLILRLTTGFPYISTGIIWIVCGTGLVLALALSWLADRLCAD